MGLLLFTAAHSHCREREILDRAGKLPESLGQWRGELSKKPLGFLWPEQILMLVTFGQNHTNVDRVRLCVLGRVQTFQGELADRL